jgi:hypothetical protein
LGLRSRTQLAVWAIEYGLVPKPEAAAADLRTRG